MSVVSISEAARLVNKCRQTIYKHIRQGKLSISICVDGSKGIDISELIRVYGILAVDKTTDISVNNRHKITKDIVDSVKSVNINQKISDLEKELTLLKFKLEQQEKDLYYKQIIIDNKEKTINAKQETIDTLKSSLKLLEHKKEFSLVEPVEATSTNVITDNFSLNFFQKFKKFLNKF